MGEGGGDDDEALGAEGADVPDETGGGGDGAGPVVFRFAEDASDEGGELAEEPVASLGSLGFGFEGGKWDSPGRLGLFSLGLHSGGISPRCRLSTPICSTW